MQSGLAKDVSLFSVHGATPVLGVNAYGLFTIYVVSHRLAWSEFVTLTSIITMRQLPHALTITYIMVKSRVFPGSREKYLEVTWKTIDTAL